MINIQWYARRFIGPKIFDVRSYYSSYKHSDHCSSAVKKNIRFFNSSPKYLSRKVSCNFTFRKHNRYFLFAGLLTWFGFKKEEEDPMISVIKLGILSMQKEEYDKAENILHLALKLAQERRDMQAQRYIFDLLANVAFKKGDFPKAEKLFLQVTKELVATGTPPDDNSIVEISLKLASIYGQTNERQKAETGFKFCIDTQQKKINELNINVSDSSLSDYEKDTILLWAMSVDWYARYLLAYGKLKEAIENFKKALEVSEKINGASHPQTLVLLNDVGSIYTLLKDYESAIGVFQKAIELSGGTDSSDIPAFYCNLGATYLQAGNVTKGEEACKTAFKLAKKFNNTEALADAEECLAEVKGLKS